MNAQSDEGHRGQLESLRGIALCLICLGIALIILGVLAVSSSFIATLATVGMFGVLLLLGAFTQIVTAFLGRRWKGFFLHLLGGMLYLVAGLFMIEQPIEAAEILTLLIAVCLFVGGILRMVMALAERFHGWGWMFVNGFVSFALGACIWRQWPLSGFWVIGLFVGIEMLMGGISWLLLGLAARSMAKSALPN